MNLFAPPSGSFNKSTLTACYDLNYNVIMWTRDTIDWRDKNEHVIYERCTKNIKSGELILMHPTLCTKNVLENVIKYYQESGFKVVTVSENISVSL